MMVSTPPAPLRAELAAEWMLEDGVDFMNHGSFGAVPRAVFDAQAGSLSRLPDGTDTNNASTDWAFSPTVTPGAANIP